MKRVILLTTALLALSMHGAPADWTHVLLSVDGRAAGVPATLVNGLGVDGQADYDAFRLVRLPKAAMAALRTRADAAGVIVEERDDFSIVDTPGASFDVRKGAPSGADMTTGYPDGTTGLYVVQFVGPVQSSWLADLQGRGAVMVQALRTNAYLLAATPVVFTQLRRLAYMQFADLYQPFEKPRELPRSKQPEPVIIQIANIAGRDAIVARIRAIDPSLTVNTYANDYLVNATVRADQAAVLTRDPLVLGIHHVPEWQISDERQAMSISTNVSASGQQPTNGTQYAAWLGGACPTCGNLAAENFWVGMADTGLDIGASPCCGFTEHPDLATREHYGTVFGSNDSECGASRPHCDVIGHGTLVAGVIGGNAATNAIDPGGFYYGSGLAPSAGLFSTKIISRNNPQAQTGDIFSWADDARNGSGHPSVSIQNHSHNDYYAFTSGQYTLSSRQFDFAVRDANGIWDAITPITLTVSAGNIRQSNGDANPTLVTAPASAKNVISVGSSENFRPEYYCSADGNDFRNLSRDSKRGALATGYLKPDLVAPSTETISAHGMFSSGAYCISNVEGHSWYDGDSGTSFAAPAAAAAALVATRFHTALPTALNPALVKAMLIAGATSMLNGYDRLTGAALTARPNNKIGFGRLSLATIMSSQARYYFDQNYIFTGSGQPWTKRLYPNDATKDVVVALVWSDAPAAAGTLVAPLVNDLDLTVKLNISSGCLFGLLGNNVNASEYSQTNACNNSATRDSSNNVEIVRFKPTSPLYVFTSFDITVRGTSVSAQGIPAGVFPSQDFALFVLNAHQ